MSDTALPRIPREKTDFAPGERMGYPELIAQVRRSMEEPCVQVVLEAVDGYVLILNQQRQILAANRNLLEQMQHDSPDCLVGLRPGEALNCVHFSEGPSGCGTSEQCRNCGAVLAILAAQQQGKPSNSECHLSFLRDGQVEGRDFRVRCTPIELGGSRLVAMVLHDVSQEKRREILEETFLHDMLNTVGGLEGWSLLLKEMDQSGVAREIVALATSLKDEVVSQRTLVEAEKGTLVVHGRVCLVTEILAQLKTLFEFHPAAAGKRLQIAFPGEEARLCADPPILLRILINMVKNALEASQPEAGVRVWYESADGRACFRVHNETVVDDSARAHLFERSFSTKAGRGRGVGTYSMKLLGERYLGGEISFTSNAAQGTIFTLALPSEPGTLEHSRKFLSTAPRKHLLLVDDDPSLRKLGELFLQRMGFAITACRDGREALALFEAAPEAYDGCLTDICMNSMDGHELARRLMALRPGLPVIMITGYSDESDIAADAGVTAILRKPYSLPELAALLRETFSLGDLPAAS